jgi:hypothetical protein
VSFVFKPDAFDFTLLRMPLVDVNGYDADDMELEIWVDRLGYVQLDVGPQRITTNNPLTIDEWTYLFFYSSCDPAGVGIDMETCAVAIAFLQTGTG